MPLGLRAIFPRNRIQPDPNVINSRVQRQLRNYGLAVAQRMAYYPPQRKPTRYRRTGDYGRGWVGPGSLTVTANSVRVVNRVRYAVYVGGPVPGAGPGRRQTALLRARGWHNITDEARVASRIYRPIINREISGRPGAGPDIQTRIL